MAEERKLPLISSAFLNVTQKCNLKCKYCFVCQQPKEITYKVAEDAAKFLARNAVQRRLSTFSGASRCLGIRTL